MRFDLPKTLLLFNASIHNVNPINQISVVLHHQQIIQKVDATWTCLKKAQTISTSLSGSKGIVIGVI